MKRKIAKIVLGGAIMLSTLAIPGYSNSLYSFSGITSGGTVTVNGSNVVTALSGVPYTLLVAGATSDPITSGTLSLSGSTLTLSGEIPAAGINSVMTLMTIGLSSPLTNTGGATILNVAASGSSVTLLPALLTDFGITGAVSSTFILSLSGSGSAGSFLVSNETLNVLPSPAVPEPSTMPLLAIGIGLGCIGLFLRRRSSKQV